MGFDILFKTWKDEEKRGKGLDRIFMYVRELSAPNRVERASSANCADHEREMTSCNETCDCIVVYEALQRSVQLMQSIAFLGLHHAAFDAGLNDLLVYELSQRALSHVRAQIMEI